MALYLILFALYGILRFLAFFMDEGKFTFNQEIIRTLGKKHFFCEDYFLDSF